MYSESIAILNRSFFRPMVMWFDLFSRWKVRKGGGGMLERGVWGGLEGPQCVLGFE